MSNLYKILKSIIEKLNALVRSVNGVKPDAKGNVDLPQPDWEQNDETAKDYIKDRPFFEISQITNLGNTYQAWLDVKGNNYPHAIDVNVNGVLYTGKVGVTIDQYVKYYWDDVTISVDRSVATISVTPSDTEWFLVKNETTLKQIDAKYLPNTNVQSDWDETDDTSDAYIKNKPLLGGSILCVATSTSSERIDVPSNEEANINLVIVYALKSTQNGIDYSTPLSCRFVKVAGGNQLYILSAKTGRGITAEELPAGIMILSRIRYSINGRTVVNYTCLNPVS